MGGDLMLLDLSGGGSRPLLARNTESESLDLPAIWPDGHAILYQRSNLHAPIPLPGQAQPQYHSTVEQIGADGRDVTTLLDDARYPGPAPDGSHFAFVRSGAAGSGIYVHSLVDSSDTELIPPGQFLALAYPRYSPDGQQLAFVAISLDAPLGERSSPLALLQPQSALAHGFPWNAWIVNADGSNLRQIQDIVDDDPSIGWSPDGSQLFIYGGWGSFVVDAVTGENQSMTFLAGYGSVGWLPG